MLGNTYESDVEGYSDNTAEHVISALLDRNRMSTVLLEGELDFDKRSEATSDSDK